MRRKKNSWAKQHIIETSPAPPPSIYSFICLLTTSPSLPPTATGRHHLPLLSSTPSPHYTTLPLLSPISHIHNVDPSPSFIWRCPPSIGVIIIVDSPNDIRFGTQGCCLHYWCRRGGCWSRWYILLITVGRDWQGGQTKEGPTEGCQGQGIVKG